jgi:acetyl-CoA carboxylase biotin carboxyl carrier protein
LSINIDQLKQILDLVREHDLAEFEIENEGLRLKLRKDAAGGLAVSGGAVVVPPPVREATVPQVAGGAPLAPRDVEETDGGLAFVTSPIVGTYYRSPEPGAPPYVEVGSTVKKGDVLCIVEAMKLMNEIDSEYDGEIVSVYVESGAPIQYGERLYAIRIK